MVSKKNIVLFGGTFIAFLIGSGFATGQEVKQYFVSYGYMGIVGAVLTLFMFLYVGTSFITTGYRERFAKPNDIFGYYCGRYLGIFFDYFSIMFIYMSFFVMIAGAGASLNEQFGFPVYVGGILLGVLAIVTVMFGLSNIVDVIGKIGPAIAIMAILIALVSIFLNPSGLIDVENILPKINILKASSNWFFAAASYVGFCILWLAAFLSSLGKEANSEKEARLGVTLGAVGFSTAVIVVALGLMANLEDIADAMIPMLVLAKKIHPSVAFVVSLMIILGIYTTAVPLLWTACSKIAAEKTKKFRIATVILGVIGIIVGLLLPFDRLVNIVYVLNGYVGILMFVMMVIKDVGNLIKNNKKI